MNESAPNWLWTGSQTEWTRNPRPNCENARLLPSKTFHAIAPIKTTVPTPASPVTAVSVLSLMRSPKRLPAGNSVGTAVKELRSVKGLERHGGSFTTPTQKRNLPAPPSLEGTGHSQAVQPCFE